MMADEFEERVQQIAQHLPYPPTPQRPHSRWQLKPIRVLGRVAILLLVVGISALSISDIRAAVLEFLQIGAVTIYLDGTSESGYPLRLEDVSGETDLRTAVEMASIDIQLPADGPPDRIFVQETDLIIFVWLQGNNIQRALYQTTDDRWDIIKTAESLVPTKVGDYSAFWIDLQRPVEFYVDGELRTELTHFVVGNVLVWAVDGVTFRLETGASLDDTRHFAESLAPVNREPTDD